LDRGFAEELPYPDASFDRVLSAFMFHHLDPAGRRRALCEVTRTLRPGGSLHLVDFGGTKHPSDGLIARLAHRNKQLRDNFGDRIPTLMSEAGLAESIETGHRVTRVGRYTFWIATRPPEP
jgi:ubiquinone/menaquinone biosynthesis C-methylase UbiE